MLNSIFAYFNPKRRIRVTRSGPGQYEIKGESLVVDDQQYGGSVEQGPDGMDIASGSVEGDGADHYIAEGEVMALSGNPQITTQEIKEVPLGGLLGTLGAILALVLAFRVFW